MEKMKRKKIGKINSLSSFSDYLKYRKYKKGDFNVVEETRTGFHAIVKKPNKNHFTQIKKGNTPDWYWVRLSHVDASNENIIGDY